MQMSSDHMQRSVTFIRVKYRTRLAGCLVSNFYIFTRNFCLLSHLVLAVKSSDAKMEYVHYHTHIEEQYMVTLKGWTHLQFKCPSKLGNNLGHLKVLYKALHDGECRFESIESVAELQRLHEENEKLIEAGQRLQPTQRKQRSDAGVSHGPNKRTKDCRKSSANSTREAGEAESEGEGEGEGESEGEGEIDEESVAENHRVPRAK